MIRNEKPIEKQKFFCPHCRLELTGNKDGDSHISPLGAWIASECEYVIGEDKSTPIPEYEADLERYNNALSTSRKMNEYAAKIKEKWKLYIK